MGFDWAITTMPYGPTLQKRRMLLHRFLSRNVMERHRSNLALETHQLVLGLIDSPDNYFNHVRRYNSIQPSPSQFFTNQQGNGGYHNDDSVWS
jgi:hypothetical protein